MENKVKIILGVFALFIFLSFFSVTKLLKQSSECAENPFVYGAKNVKDQGLDLSCTCYFQQPNYNSFTFDDKGIKQIVEQYSIRNYEILNISLLE